jgi:hypothetical protein
MLWPGSLGREAWGGGGGPVSTPVTDVECVLVRGLVDMLFWMDP